MKKRNNEDMGTSNSSTRLWTRLAFGLSLEMKSLDSGMHRRRLPTKFSDVTGHPRTSSPTPPGLNTSFRSPWKTSSVSASTTLKNDPNALCLTRTAPHPDAERVRRR